MLFFIAFSAPGIFPFPRPPKGEASGKPEFLGFFHVEFQVENHGVYAKILVLGL